MQGHYIYLIQTASYILSPHLMYVTLRQMILNVGQSNRALMGLDEKRLVLSIAKPD